MAAEEDLRKETLVKISQLAKLSGVSTPTIKYYMSEGLLPGPALKTSRNMAYYDPKLAERVKVIKELQSSYFFPLKMIGEILEPAPSARVRDDIDVEMKRKLGQLGEALEARTSESSKAKTGSLTGPMKAKDIVAQWQLSKAELSRLEKLGLAEPTKGDDGQLAYDGAALDLIRVIHETREEGLGDLFPMDILETYVEAVGQLVRSELGLFRQRVLEGAEIPSKPFDEVTRDATRLSERLVISMRSQLLIREVGNMLSGSPKG